MVSGENMKVIMMRPSYAPEISGGTHLALNLVDDLIKNGDIVEVIAPAPHRANEQIKKKYKNLKREEKYNGKLVIHRVSSPFGEKTIFLRALRLLSISLGMFNKARKIKDAGVIMSHSMPPFLGPLAIVAGKIKRLPVVYWEQDIVSESLISTGVAAKGIKKNILFNSAKLFEKISSKGSNHIITISEKFKKSHTKMNVKDNKIDVVYNWIDTDKFIPINKENNFLFDDLEIKRSDFIITYCGNLGLPQNVEILVDAAKKLNHLKDLKIVILGNGVRKNHIEQYIEKSNLNNTVSLHPLVPLEKAHYAYSLGDIGVVVGRKGTSNNGFPSKTWSIMAAGQAMISCFDQDSELSSFVREGECGISLPPDDSEKLAEAIEYYYNNRDKVREHQDNSRHFVVNNFSRPEATSKIIEVLKKSRLNNEKEKKYV